MALMQPLTPKLTSKISVTAEFSLSRTRTQVKKIMLSNSDQFILNSLFKINKNSVPMFITQKCLVLRWIPKPQILTLATM